MKKFAIGCFVFAMAMSSQASWLWWQVQNQVTTGNTGAEYSFGFDYNAGKIYAVNGSGSPIALFIADPETGETITGAIRARDTEAYAINLSQLQGDLNSYSFYIEYVNYKDKTDAQIAIGESATYQSLASSITDEMSMVPSVVVWHGGTMNAPEPTSAMLMLLGVSGLALRRKQRKLA